MFITLKSRLHTRRLPPGGPLLVAAAGAWLLRSRSAGAARAGWLLLGAGLASLWLLATPPGGGALGRGRGGGGGGGGGPRGGGAGARSDPSLSGPGDRHSRRW